MATELLYLDRIPMSAVDTEGRTPDQVARLLNTTTPYVQVRLEPGDHTRYVLHLLLPAEAGGLIVLRVVGWETRVVTLDPFTKVRPEDVAPVAPNPWTATVLAWYLDQVLGSAPGGA